MTFSCYAEHPVFSIQMGETERTADVNRVGVEHQYFNWCLWSICSLSDAERGCGDKAGSDATDESVFWTSEVLPILQMFESFSPGDH